MPCDSKENLNNIFIFHEILDNISNIRESTGIKNCIIAGDHNTELSRVNSTDSTVYVENEGLIFCCNGNLSPTVDYKHVEVRLTVQDRVLIIVLYRLTCYKILSLMTFCTMGAIHRIILR